MTIPLTRSQVRRIDQLAVAEYGMSALVLMENAGRGAAEILDHEYGPAGAAIVICGTGNNGGDGFVIARHLHNVDWSVRSAIAGNFEDLTPDAAINAQITRRMGIPTTTIERVSAIRKLTASIRPDEVVVDALLGTGFTGTVREMARQLIDRLNQANQRATVAIDIPSGLDCDTGKPGGVAIRADHTITFVAPKIGFADAEAIKHLGVVHVVPIGCPKALIDAVVEN